MKREWRIQNNKCIKRWLPYKSCRYSRSSPQQRTSKRQPVGFDIVIIEHRHRTIWENWPREQRYDMVSWSNVGSRVTILYVRDRERDPAKASIRCCGQIWWWHREERVMLRVSNYNNNNEREKRIWRWNTH